MLLINNLHKLPAPVSNRMHNPHVAHPLQVEEDASSRISIRWHRAKKWFQELVLSAHMHEEEDAEEAGR